MKCDTNLLRALWDRYEAPPSKKTRLFWKRMATQIRDFEGLRDSLVEHEDCGWADLDRCIDDLRCAVEVGIAFDGQQAHRPSNWVRNYWAGALVPYLALKTRQPNWKWLAEWLSVVEGKKLEPAQLRHWASRIRSEAPASLPKRGKRSILNKRISLLFESGKRDLLALSYGALNVVTWLRRRKGSTKAPDRYLAKAYRCWPSFKKVFPHISYLRRS